MRLKIIPDITKIDFFGPSNITFGLSILAVIASVVTFFVMGLNFGIDFQGGTTIRTQADTPVVIADYRAALSPLGLGDISISKVVDPADTLSGIERHVTQIRIEQQEGAEAAGADTITTMKTALLGVDASMQFLSVESVGPKVSGELINTAILAVVLSIFVVLIYIWLRFEWQFSVGAVVALIHDVMLTIGVFSLFQFKFDLAIIAALLTIVGYSLNDTVVVFDRVRENLRKYKKTLLVEVLNLSINETLSRTFMTSFTTLVALFALIILGGDVIRGFVFAMTWGIVVGTYSSVFVASKVLLFLGVKRDWTKSDNGGGTQFANIDA